MKQFTFLLFISFLITSCDSFGQVECLICGEWKWEKNDEKHDFTLQILQHDSIIEGKHCYVLDAGNKMDCSTAIDDFSFKFEIPRNDSLTFKIRSYYSNEFGTASIKYLDGKIYWRLLQLPKGEYYLPREAV